MSSPIPPRVVTSTASKCIIALLALLYSLGTLAAFTMAGLVQDSHLRMQRIAHGCLHAIVAISWTSTLVLALKRSRAADVSAAVGVTITLVLATKAFFSEIVGGSRSYSWMEPLFVLLATYFILRILLQRHKGKDG